jgi:L-threonylcarbamoyladenylate synthase
MPLFERLTPRKERATVPADRPARGDSPEIAAEALKTGRLVILPTETVYGLAADASNPQAVARIFEAKGRPRFNPLIAHVANAVDAEDIAVFDAKARALAEAFWPGPLTIVAPVRDRDRVCDLARAGLDSVAVRVPAHPRARAVIGAFGGPVVAPSANRSGRPSPTTFADALEETGHAVGAAVDGGSCAVGVESTVVSVLDGKVSLLRPGSVIREELQAAPLEHPGGVEGQPLVAELVHPTKNRGQTIRHGFVLVCEAKLLSGLGGDGDRDRSIEGFAEAGDELSTLLLRGDATGLSVVES